MICINGQEYDKSEIRLCDFLDENGFDAKRIAVELNGEILPKSKYPQTTLTNGDRVEIVSFVGGG